MHRLEKLADSDSDSDSDSDEDSDSGSCSGVSVRATVPRTPPRWKIAVITWLGIFPSVVILVCIVGLFIPPKSFLLWGNIIVTVLATIVMTYVVMPGLTRLLARWLDASESA